MEDLNNRVLRNTHMIPDRELILKATLSESITKVEVIYIT